MRTCALQLKQVMLDPVPKKRVQDSHRAGIQHEMAELKEELLTEGVKPCGIKVYTNDAKLQALFPSTDANNSDKLPAE